MKDYIQELLQTSAGTEGSLLIVKKIHDQLIMEVDKALIPRSEAALFAGPGMIPGSSLDINLEAEDAMDVRLVGEGAEIPLDNDEYSNVNSKPLKYGVAIRITRELMEDSKWPLLQLNVRKAGKRFAENETSLIVTALDGAANTVTGGSAITIANITRAMQYLEDADYEPTSFLVGNEVVNDLRNIDTFVEADKAGNNEMISRGFLGTIFGMNVMRASPNAGLTKTSSYVFDKTQAYAITEKRPITVENFMLPQFDMSGAAVTQRITATLLRSNAVAKITTS